MSTEAQNLLSGFDALPFDDQQFIVAETLRRSASWDLPPLSDDDLARIADDLFVHLDEDEA